MDWLTRAPEPVKWVFTPITVPMLVLLLLWVLAATWTQNWLDPDYWH